MITVKNVTISKKAQDQATISGNKLSYYAAGSPENYDYNIQIRFLNCHFIEASFPLMRGDNFFFAGFEVGFVLFENCTFTASRLIYDVTDPFETEFRNCTFTESFYIHFEPTKGATSYVPLELYSCTFEIEESSNIHRFIKYATDTQIDISTSEWIRLNGEQHPEGYVFYKQFDLFFPPARHWVIKKDSVLTESLDRSPDTDCSYGLNVTSRNNLLIMGNSDLSVWKVLLKFEDMADAIRPYFSKKLRIARGTLLEKITWKELIEGHPS